MTLQELLAKRASNVKAMRELNDKVLSENRAYTAEETAMQERMDAEYADLDTKIATATKLAEREADLAKNLREPLADKREEDVSKANEKIEANYREVFPKLLSRGIHNLSSGEMGVVNAYRVNGLLQLRVDGDSADSLIFKDRSVWETSTSSVSMDNHNYALYTSHDLQGGLVEVLVQQGIQIS